MEKIKVYIAGRGDGGIGSSIGYAIGAVATLTLINYIRSLFD